MRHPPYVAYDPGRRLVYGVGRTPAEAYDDAVFQAGVIQGATQPWATLITTPTTEAGAQLVLASNGPAALADVEAAR